MELIRTPNISPMLVFVKTCLFEDLGKVSLVGLYGPLERPKPHRPLDVRRLGRNDADGDARNTVALAGDLGGIASAQSVGSREAETRQALEDGALA